MTSTNHFRNRRISGSQRALVRTPCECPPAVAAGVSVYSLTADVLFAGVASWGPVSVNLTATPAVIQPTANYQCTGTDVEGDATFELNFVYRRNNSGFIADMWANNGGGWEYLDSVFTLGFTLPLPYNSGLQNWNNDFDPSHGITLTVN